MSIEEQGLSPELIDNGFKELAKENIECDLRFLLDQYRSPEIGLRLLAEKTHISEKTLRRIVYKGTSPHFNTMARFYEHFLKVVQGSHLKDGHYKLKKIFEDAVSNGNLSDKKLSDEFRNNDVFRQIYLVSRTGPITERWVGEQFGKYGLDVVAKMLDGDLLIEIDRGLYKQTDKGLHKDGQTIKKCMEWLLSEQLSADCLDVFGENSAFYAVEGLNEKGLAELMKRMEEFKTGVVEILNNAGYKGHQRAFVIGAVDKMNALNGDELRSEQ